MSSSKSLTSPSSSPKDGTVAAAATTTKNLPDICDAIMVSTDATGQEIIKNKSPSKHLKQKPEVVVFGESSSSSCNPPSPKDPSTMTKPLSATEGDRGFQQPQQEVSILATTSFSTKRNNNSRPNRHSTSEQDAMEQLLRLEIQKEIQHAWASYRKLYDLCQITSEEVKSPEEKKEDHKTKEKDNNDNQSNNNAKRPTEHTSIGKKKDEKNAKHSTTTEKTKKKKKVKKVKRPVKSAIGKEKMLKLKSQILK